MILGHVFRQLLDEAPVGGLLIWDDDIWRQNLQRLHIWRQGGRRRVGAQHQNSLHSCVDPGQVELLQRGKRLIQESIDDVYSSFLTNENQSKKGCLMASLQNMNRRCVYFKLIFSHDYYLAEMPTKANTELFIMLS